MMGKKIYIVFESYSYDTFEGTWNGDSYIDSVWDNQEDAKLRIKDLANEFIEKMWYENEAIPGQDYDEVWRDDKTGVEFEPDSYSNTSFYIEVHELRSGFPQDIKDLPAYFTTT